MSESLHLTRNGSILEITLDRPKANAIDAKTSFEMGEVFLNFRDDPQLRVAIITGAGEKFFSAGWDLKAAAEGEAPDADFGPGGFAGLTEIFNLDKPVIAAVNGYAFGGGFELALAADFIVCADNASFALPEAKLGIVPDSGGVLRLPKILPPAIVNEMVMTGRRMGAEEALRWGVVNRVVSQAELMDNARAVRSVSDDELHWKRLNTKEYQDLVGRCHAALHETQPLRQMEENRPRLQGTTDVTPKR